MRRSESYLELAEHLFRLAKTSDKLHDAALHEAFHLLFRAAHEAVMEAFHYRTSRWGRLASRLPPPLRQEFRKYADVLHIAFHYIGALPSAYDQWFFYWRDRVRCFIEAVLRKEPAPPLQSPECYLQTARLLLRLCEEVPRGLRQRLLRHLFDELRSGFAVLGQVPDRLIELLRRLPSGWRQSAKYWIASLENAIQKQEA